MPLLNYLSLLLALAGVPALAGPCEFMAKLLPSRTDALAGFRGEYRTLTTMPTGEPLKFTDHNPAAGSYGSKGKGVVQVVSVETGTDPSPFVPAHRHPQFKDRLQAITDAGGYVLLDPSMIRSSGICFPELKTISLRPDANWYVFVHEFHHFLFDRYVTQESYEKYGRLLRAGSPTAAKVFPLEQMARAGFHVDALAAAARDGLPFEALDEHLSTAAEIQALEAWDPAHPQVQRVKLNQQIYRRKYLLAHLLGIPEAKRSQKEKDLLASELAQDAKDRAQLGPNNDSLIPSKRDVIVLGSLAAALFVGVVNAATVLKCKPPAKLSFGPLGAACFCPATNKTLKAGEYCPAS